MKCTRIFREATWCISQLVFRIYSAQSPDNRSWSVGNQREITSLFDLLKNRMSAGLVWKRLELYADNLFLMGPRGIARQVDYEASAIRDAMSLTGDSAVAS